MEVAGHVYCHINNGGVAFSVVDEGNGPVVRIDSSHFGTNTMKHDLHVSPNELKLLAEMFTKAAAHQSYSETYCCAAKADKIGGVADVCMANEGGPPPGFPQDDEFSIQQGDNGTANLDLWYSHQFVQNECVEHRGNKTNRTAYKFDKGFVLEGTVCGTIYVKDPLKYNGYTKFAVQTFQINFNGEFKPTNIGHPELKVVAGKMDHLHGKLSLEWNGVPEGTELVVNYEYDMNKNDKAQLDALSKKGDANGIHVK
jgi:hypothetical protein